MGNKQSSADGGGRGNISEDNKRQLHFLDGVFRDLAARSPEKTIDKARCEVKCSVV
jgi:hypothetical protein